MSNRNQVYNMKKFLGYPTIIKDTEALNDYYKSVSEFHLNVDTFIYRF